jgi:hypothetical protein
MHSGALGGFSVLHLGHCICLAWLSLTLLCRISPGTTNTKVCPKMKAVSAVCVSERDSSGRNFKVTEREELDKVSGKNFRNCCSSFS